MRHEFKDLMFYLHQINYNLTKEIKTTIYMLIKLVCLVYFTT